MEPRIQYAQTKDGVSIAFYRLGEGMPLVSMPPDPLSHLQLEWQWPELRRWYERLAEKRMLVRYDPRGAGLSDRDVTDLSLDGRLLDLEAVVDRLGSDRFALLGFGDSGPLAVAYAARYPERVSHLILWCSYARGADYLSSPTIRAELALKELRDKDWEAFTETWAHLMMGWSEGEEARRLAAFLRECATPEGWRAATSAHAEVDVTALLPNVRSPTLVLHRRQFRLLSVDSARQLASRIPNARLIVLEGETPMPWADDTNAVASAIDEFLGEGEEAAPGAAPSGLVTILFTDVEGSTALTQRLGDAKARELLREHERMVREALKAHGGSEVKTLGDGFMTSFSSATKALECAIAMQRAFADWNQGVRAALAPPQGAASDAPTAPTATEPLHVRIGLNAGEPIAEDDPDGRADLYGTAVNEAARITATAKGGEILVSDVVRELAKGKDFLFVDRGEATLKGFDEPVRLYEVRWED